MPFPLVLSVRFGVFKGNVFLPEKILFVTSEIICGDRGTQEEL